MEVEIKIPLSDSEVKRVKEILDSIGQFIEKKVEKDTYFNHPCRDFMKTDEALRVRKARDSIRLTYKGPKIDQETKTREEIDLEVSHEDIELLLKKLGFKVAGYVEKVREIYSVDEAIICVDDVSGLGKFIEVEIYSDNLENAKSRIFEILTRLGLDRNKSIRKSYLEMVFEKV